MAQNHKLPQSNEALCVLAQQGNEDAYLQLLIQNQAYIVKQMKKLKFRYHPYWNEMMEWGEIGIMSSINDYDPSRGTKFLTFATPRIRTELREFLKSIRMAYMENNFRITRMTKTVGQEMLCSFCPVGSHVRSKSWF